MCDVMSFPATIEEFMEQYKIVDREEVYTNGAEMVPIFRMKQWFEHEALGKDINVPSKSALDHIHNVVRDDAYKRGYEQGKDDAAPAVSVNGNTFMIDVSEEDFDKIKRVIVGCGPMCRTFYEEGGEAHWIKKYTPDDGEIYECDNCGVVWQFNDGGPEENEAHYCPKCGFKMVPKEGEQNEQID